MRVSINILRGNGTAGNTCLAMADGIRASGDTAVLRSDGEKNLDGFDAAVFWGYVTTCQELVAECQRRSIPFLYIDLPYWLRNTHYKVTLNARHPDQYLMHNAMPEDRFKGFGVKIQPWRREGRGEYILLSGMSGKAAWSWNFGPAEFETDMVTKLRGVTKRPILYRPKPNWTAATPIPGTTFDNRTPIDKLIDKAHCVVTHHSNVGVDAVVRGVPVFARRGAAIHMACSDVDMQRLEDPVFPEGREQWAANLAYCQWSINEMQSGVCWRHMKEFYLKGPQG